MAKATIDAAEFFRFTPNGLKSADRLFDFQNKMEIRVCSCSASLFAQTTTGFCPFCFGELYCGKTQPLISEVHRKNSNRSSKLYLVFAFSSRVSPFFFSSFPPFLSFSTAIKPNHQLHSGSRGSKRDKLPTLRIPTTHHFLYLPHPDGIFQ